MTTQYTIRMTDEFSNWLDGLVDTKTRIRLARRLEKAQQGNLGDVKPVSKGVYEMRERFGPGWRMYYVERGNELIVMLGGGNKSSQQRDIKKAVKLSETVE